MSETNLKEKENANDKSSQQCNTVNALIIFYYYYRYNLKRRTRS